MDAATILKTALPWIGAAATGGVPALTAMALGKLSDVFGTNVKTVDDAAAALQKATPEQLVELRRIESDFQARMKEAGYKHVEEMGRQALETYKADKADVADARKTFTTDGRVFALAVIILICFGACVVTVMVGSFMLLTGAEAFKQVDPAVVAVVSGLIGTIVGYIAANAQQVVSYFFGSSQGSKNSGDAVRNSLQEALRKLSERVPT